MILDRFTNEVFVHLILYQFKLTYLAFKTVGLYGANLQKRQNTSFYSKVVLTSDHVLIIVKLKVQPFIYHSWYIYIARHRHIFAIYVPRVALTSVIDHLNFLEIFNIRKYIPSGLVFVYIYGRISWACAVFT